MKTEDIKKMGLAYVQVLEANKKTNKHGHDSVGQEDDDIDNDGDVDSSDEYLHNRRKAISHAMKKEAYSDAHRAKMAKSYKGKNPHHINAMSSDKGTMTIVTNNGNKYFVTAKETGGKMPKTGDHINRWKPGAVKEAAEGLDEVSKDLLGRYATKAHNRGDMAARMSNHGRNKDMADIANKRYSGVQKAISKLSGRARVNATEEVELDEDISKMSHSRLKWHMNTGVPHGSYSKDDLKKERDRRMKYRDSADAYKKAKSSMSEAADLNATNADKAMRHDCATHVEHAEWGRGQPIKGEHTIVETADGEGYVTHYDVMFEHGIEKNVAVEDLNILASESHMHANKKRRMRESNNWPIYSRILEKRDMHTKGATAAEPIDSKASQGEKDFVNMHGGLNGNDSGIDGAKAALDTAKAATAGVKIAPKRPGDAIIGDKTMPKA